MCLYLYYVLACGCDSIRIPPRRLQICKSLSEGGACSGIEEVTQIKGSTICADCRRADETRRRNGPNGELYTTVYTHVRWTEE